MAAFIQRFDDLDTRLNLWLVAHSITLLRVAMGGIFLLFGFLKYFPSISPIEDLATRTTAVLTLGMITGHTAMVFVATLECVIGLCFLTGRFLRIGVWLMGAQMIGAMSPLLLFPGELFNGPFHAPSIVAQYIIKDVVLVAAGMVIAATWTGARIFAERRSMRSTLRTALPPVATSGQLAGAEWSKVTVGGRSATRRSK